VSEASEAGKLRGLLRAAFAARLEPEGWQMLGGEDEDLSVAAFICPLGRDFAASAEVLRTGHFPDKPPEVVTRLFVGVSYEPLRRLWPLLDQFRVAVVREDVWPPMSDEEDDGVPGLEVSGPRDVERVADELAPLILERAPDFARRYASLDVLLAELGGAERHMDIRHAAVLAAAGRSEEARSSLALWRPPVDRVLRRERRAARQLRRWIDSGGDPALIPVGPPASRFALRKGKSFSELRAQEAKRRAAVEEVKKSARGRSRDEARAMLRQELVRRGVEEQSPLWTERTLDHLWDSPADQIRLGMRALKGVARFAMAAGKAIKDRELPDLSLPDWLEPPDHALYEFPSTDPVVGVNLDPDARPWLEGVYEALPKVAGSGHLSAWLKRASPGGLELIVYLGERRVGSVPADAVPAYREVVGDAAFRDENPCVRARLTLRGPGYLLEIARPA
jgi:hypothetical protein